MTNGGGGAGAAYWKGFLSEAFPYWYSMFQFCDTRMARELVYRWVYRYTRGRHVVDTLLILFWHVTPSTVCFVPMPLGKRRCRVRQRRLSRTRNSWELHDVDLTARTTERRPLLAFGTPGGKENCRSRTRRPLFRTPYCKVPLMDTFCTWNDPLNAVAATIPYAK